MHQSTVSTSFECYPDTGNGAKKKQSSTIINNEITMRMSKVNQISYQLDYWVWKPFHGIESEKYEKTEKVKKKKSGQKTKTSSITITG